MTVPPSADERYQVVVRSGANALLLARLRAAGHSGRVRLTRLRGWLHTPQGRRVVANTGRGLGLGAVLLGGWMLARRWSGAAQAAAAALVGGYRRVAGAVSGAADAVRFVLSLRWIARLLAWWSILLGRSNHQESGHVRCADCHARIRADARVCFRCGLRRDGADAGVRRRPPLIATLRWTGRVLALRLYRRCPDCRRLTHADARVCRSCGYRLTG